MTTRCSLFGKWTPSKRKALADGQKVRAMTYLGHLVEGVVEGSGIRISEYSGLAYEAGDFIGFPGVRKRTLEVWDA